MSDGQSSCVSVLCRSLANQKLKIKGVEGLRRCSLYNLGGRKIATVARSQQHRIVFINSDVSATRRSGQYPCMGPQVILQNCRPYQRRPILQLVRCDS